MRDISVPLLPIHLPVLSPSLGLRFTLGTEIGARLPLWHHLPCHLSPAPRSGHQLCTLCLRVFSGLWSGLPEGPCSALSGLCVELQSVGSLASGQEALSQGSWLSPFPFPCPSEEEMLPPVCGGLLLLSWCLHFALGLGMGGAIHQGLSHMLSSDPHKQHWTGAGKVNSERHKQQPGEGK